MGTDDIDDLVEQTYEIFDETSIHEIIDLDDHAAQEFLNSTYDYPDAELVARYIAIVRLLK